MANLDCATCKGDGLVAVDDMEHGRDAALCPDCTPPGVDLNTGLVGDDYETDLSSCPYFNGTGICSFGCWDEPRCHTCEPANGWPSMRTVPDASVA